MRCNYLVRKRGREREPPSVVLILLFLLLLLLLLFQHDGGGGGGGGHRQVQKQHSADGGGGGVEWLATAARQSERDRTAACAPESERERETRGDPKPPFSWGGVREGRSLSLSLSLSLPPARAFSRFLSLSHSRGESREAGRVEKQINTGGQAGPANERTDARAAQEPARQV